MSKEFPGIPTADWEAAIIADLKGADYQKKLTWKSEDGIVIRPYYRSEDLPPSSVPTRAAETWQIRESLEIPANAINAAQWHDNGATPVQELAFALLAAADRLEAGDTNVAFVFGIGSNYFFEIAKLRAARLLWGNLTSAFGLAPSPAKIHARTALANKSIYDPYTNLLRVTTETLSAAIGGADSITVVPAHFPARLAPNVQHVIQEEARVDTVPDPSAGSYFIESLTDTLAREAWALFQQNPSIDDSLAVARTAKEKAFALRRTIMVGVNNYVDAAESLDGIPTDIEGSGWRLARPIELIRQRVERHPQPLHVHLLKHGESNLRAAFSRNFFACAGLKITESDTVDPAANLIVLCSTDPEYPAFAAGILPQAKVPVLIAGNPAEKPPGIAGYIHTQSNQVESLNEWITRLGVAH